MEIMLHLGAHRSASTSFQGMLWDNRTALSRQGLTSWTPRRTRDGLMRGLMRHPALLTAEDERRAKRSIGRLRLEFQRLSRAGQTGLFISDENILGSMANNMADTRLYPLVRERLTRLAPAFEGHTLRIGVCIRSYEDFWTSCLTYLIARGHGMPSEDEVDFLTTQNRRWRDVVRDIKAVFPDADVFAAPFERMAGRPEKLLAAFLDKSCDGLAVQDVWRNRGPNLVQLNELLIMRGEAPEASDLFEAHARWMPFGEAHRTMLRAEYRRDLAWLMGGGEGLVRLVDGRPETARCLDQESTPKEKQMRDGLDIRTKTIGDGRVTPAPRPDRAEDICAAHIAPAPFGGQYDGIKEGLERARTT